MIQVGDIIKMNLDNYVIRYDSDICPYGTVIRLPESRSRYYHINLECFGGRDFPWLVLESEITEIEQL